MLEECLETKNLQCLDYRPMTAILGRVFEQIGDTFAAKNEGHLARLFRLAGKLVPYWVSAGIRRVRPNTSQKQLNRTLFYV